MFTVTMAADGAQERLEHGLWHLTCPAADLTKWLALHRRLRDRDGGRFAAFHAGPVSAIETAMRAAGIPVPPEVEAKAPVARGKKRS